MPGTYTIFVMEKAPGKFDVYIDGNQINEAVGLSYQTALSRARDLFRRNVPNRNGGGYIIVEKLDGSRETITV